MQGFCEGLITLHDLEEIYLKLTHSQRPEGITYIGMQSLGQALKHLTSLQKFDFYFGGFDKINATGIGQLTQVFEALANLKNVSLYFRKYTITRSITKHD